MSDKLKIAIRALVKAVPLLKGAWTDLDVNNAYEILDDALSLINSMEDEPVQIVIPKGVPFITCPECGAEIQHGFSDEVVTKIRNSKLFSKPVKEDAIEFAEFCAINFHPTIVNKEVRYWQKGSYQNKERFYSTKEVRDLFKEQTINNGNEK